MLYIIRHGETELNSKHVLQGRSDNELDSKGFDQSRKASDWLKKEGISFTKVYSSPLKRAVQTAECVAPGITEYLDKDAKGRYWSKNIGNCEIYRVECSDGIFGVPESVFRIKKLLF